MNRLVLLDAGPLGLATNPRESVESRRCKEWLKTLLSAGVRVMVPEIADYEVRRELLRANRREGIIRLDALAEQIGYLPLNTDVLRLAAELWAESRRGGFPTADDKALDADVILAAQARLADIDPEFDVVIATNNPGHLSRFVSAVPWSAIS
ncbi:MAG: PIN domain-containing protein [Isosphaerales bacterium]